MSYVQESCGERPIPHVLSECGALVQSKYKARHDTALKVLFFYLLSDVGLIESVPSWCSLETPKPEYKNEARAFWDVPVYVEKSEVTANRIDARVADKQKKKVLLLEMSCPWMTKRRKKSKPLSTHRLDGRCISSTHTIRLHSTTSSLMCLGAYQEKHYIVLKNSEVSGQIRSYWICKRRSSQVPLILHGVSKFSLHRTYELLNFYPYNLLLFRFFISSE